MVNETSSYSSQDMEKVYNSIYDKVKKLFPNTDFWLIEQYGKRSSYICGDRGEFAFNPVKVNIVDRFYLFFSSGTDEKTVNEITEIFKSGL